MNCPSCRTEKISPHYTACPQCGFWLDYPNVRAAKAEARDLARRHASARKRARLRGVESALNRFEAAVASEADVVVSKEWGFVIDRVQRDEDLFDTFHARIRSGQRVSDNSYDQGRPAVEGLLFPHYAEKISYGALSLDGRAPDYGPCRFRLRKEELSRRMTLFESNSFVFVREKRVPAVGPLPSGYRATWDDRGRLATIKHAKDLHRGISAAAFPGILVRGAGRETGFIEVHVYGRIPLEAVERLTAPAPPLDEDQGLRTVVERKLARAGVEVAWV